ncbi:MAG TPA: HepT-like ribonuclease domain-containing protein [Thermoanaerobaculia bacterium]
MRKRSDAFYISDMLTYARRTAERVHGLSREDFDATLAHQESVAYNIMIIGEAASKVSDETRAAYPVIPWNQIKAMRNQIVHGYAETDHNELWDTATKDIPILIAELERISQ